MQTSETRKARLEALVFVLLLSSLLTSLFAFVHPWYDLTNDGSTYLITARAIANGEGYSYLGDTFRIRPPGFSAMLALFDPTGSNFAIVNMLVSVFGVAGCALLYLHQRPYLGRTLAVLVSVAVWLNPGYRRLCTEVMSDVPGLALVIACLLIERWASRRPALWRDLILAVSIGMTAYVRSIAILLVPAILLARLFARMSDARSGSAAAGSGWGRFVLERLVPVALAAWLVLLPWSLARDADRPPPPAEQTLNYSLGTAMWHEDPGDPASRRYGPGEILSRLPSRLEQMATVIGSRMQHRIPGSAEPGGAATFGYGAVALAMAACWLWVLIRRRAAAEWFVAGVSFVVGLYFVFTDRLALPIWVFLLCATVEVVRDLTRRLAGERVALALPAVALVLLTVVDFAPRQGWKEMQARQLEFVELQQELDRVMEPDAVVAAGQGFHYGVFLDRPVYNLMHVARRSGRAEAVEQTIDRHGINTVVLSPLVPPDMALVPYFQQRYGPGTPVGAGLAWRVRSAARPHLFLITSDTLRADHLGIFGYERETSPAIDRFAGRAWHFTDAVTVIPKTGPAFATLFSGRHPRQHGVQSNFEAVPAELPMLAERLQQAGYETAAFVGNPVLREGIGFARGFDSYRLYDGRRDEGVQSVNAAFFEWLDARDDPRPIFVWIHYMDPHGPYAPPVELERPFLEDELARSDDRRVPLRAAERPSGNANKVLGAIPEYQQRDGEDRVAIYVARYDAEIRYMDAAFDEVIRRLEERGLFDSSAVVFTSDHGEALGEHDLWFEHGWFAHEATLRIPLMVKLPGQQTGEVVDRQVSLLDVAPTLATLGVIWPDDDWVGSDLVGEADREPRLLVENSNRYPVKFYGIRTSRWKYIVRETDGQERLYDLQADPLETVDLSVQEAQRLGGFRVLCQRALWQMDQTAVQQGEGPIDDPETLERLRALGYDAGH